MAAESELNMSIVKQFFWYHINGSCENPNHSASQVNNLVFGCLDLIMRSSLELCS